MRRIILSMLLLAGATTYAQVGINKEDPKATLDINAKEESSPSNKVEGLLIPRVSKEKALLMAGNGELQESTMIYVNSMTITSSPNATVEDITENGYYFWNKTKWVKQTGQNGEEWIYDPTTKQINLKRSGQGEFKGKVFYNKIGGYNNLDFMLRKTSSGDREVSTDNLIPNDFSFLNTVIKNTSSITPIAPDFLGGNKYRTGINYNLLKVDNLSNSGNIYVGSNVLSVDNTATISVDAGNLYGTQGLVLYNNSRKVWGLIGVEGIAELSGSSRAVNVFGSEFKAFTDENATSDRISGVNVWVDHKGTSNYASGVSSNLKISGTVNRKIANGSFRINLLGNTNKVTSTSNFIHIDENATTTEAISVESGFGIKSGATVETLYGYRMNTSDIATGANITDFYGIYLEDVKGASNDNYSIYTKAGKLRFGDLADSSVSEKRLVVADTDGVLSTSTTSLSDLESLWANDASNTRVYLKKTSTGTNRVDTQGDPTRNSVTINDAGAITAKGFIGYNGASIFPDYVFEKYYKGYSNIKADYDFHNLTSVETFIKKNGHLPGYQSAKEIAKEGLIDIGATQLTNIEKIEELYLHTIEQEKKIEAKDAKIEKLEAELKSQKENFEKRIERLEKLIKQ